MIVTLPSGLSGEIRGLKGKDLGLLSDKAAMRAGQHLDGLLKACWVKTLDPGPYTLGPNGELDWSKVLVGDRAYAFIQMRVKMFGPDFDFTVKCRERDCGEKIKWSIDIRNLPVKRLSEADAKAFRAGNDLETSFSTGNVVRFRLPTGEDEHRAAKIRLTDDKELRALMMRITYIGGIETLDPKTGVSVDLGAHDEGRLRFLQEADLADISELVEHFEERNCGVDTSIEIACPACGTEQKIELPFENFMERPKKPKP